MQQQPHTPSTALQPSTTPPPHLAALQTVLPLSLHLQLQAMSSLFLLPTACVSYLDAMGRRRRLSGSARLLCRMVGFGPTKCQYTACWDGDGRWVPIDVELVTYHHDTFELEAACFFQFSVERDIRALSRCNWSEEILVESTCVVRTGIASLVVNQIYRVGRMRQ